MHISRWTQPLNSFVKFVYFSARICLLCWNMLLLKCVWVWILSAWMCAWNSSRQRLSGEKANFNENECNMWIQVFHWSIRTSEPIQHLNLPPPLLTRPHQCQPLLSYPLSSASLLTGFHSLCWFTLIHPCAGFECPQKTTLLWLSCHGPPSKQKLLNIIYQVFVI